MYINKRVVFSLAFLSLRSATAIKVYLIFLYKCKWEKLPIRPGCKDKEWCITNNGKIQFTYDEAEKYGISRGTFVIVIDKLIEVGLIDISKQGSGLHKDVSLYAISDRWEKYGTPEFEKQARKKRKTQYGFAKGNKCAAVRWEKQRISQHSSNALEQVQANSLEKERQKCRA